jgi:hypothetical protein
MRVFVKIAAERLNSVDSIRDIEITVVPNVSVLGELELGEKL